MSAPHPDEIRELLALPPAAREALARCEGPGWIVAHSGAEPCYGPPPALCDGLAWLPCDTAAILDVAAQYQAHVRHTVDLARLTGDAWTARLGAFSEWRTGEGETPRLAALRLLAAVS